MSENIKLLYIDLFCGAGGTTTGVEYARIGGCKCAKVVACVNHDANAIASHYANHKEAVHFTEDIRTLNIHPLRVLLENRKREHPGAKTVLWASLECTNFSKAKGGQPRDADSRTLAEHLFRYIAVLDPDYIQIENVVEFMSWGDLDEHGRPVDMKKGKCYLQWVSKVCRYGYHYDYRILNSANFGAYTSRTRFFGIFAKKGLTIAFPEATHQKTLPDCRQLTIDGYVAVKQWKPVREVLDFDDEGKSIFTRTKPLVEATLQRVYAGLVKFISSGDESFLVKWNSMNRAGKYNAPGINEPCPTVSVQNRLGVAKYHFLSKQYSGDDGSKNISVDNPSGTITTIDHHALVTYYGNGQMVSVESPSPTLTTKDRLAKITFIDSQYGNGGAGSSIDGVCPAVLSNPKQNLVTAQCFLMNPQYNSVGGSVDSPCFTLIARMDKMPPYLVRTERGFGIEVYDTDSPMTIKLKKLMADYGIIDIKMRMLKISELKAIMGFPSDYRLIGTQAEQKKYIGNAVEVNTSKALCEALAETVNQ